MGERGGKGQATATYYHLGAVFIPRGRVGELGGRKRKSLRNSMIFISAPRIVKFLLPFGYLYGIASAALLRYARPALCVCVCVCKYLARMYFLGARHVPIKSSRRVSCAK